MGFATGMIVGAALVYFWPNIAAVAMEFWHKINTRR